ncbi:MAG: ATP synthase F0 subunit B [Deltaproteobacteria bacterium]|nr:ATP synthase F0 subunit B [Candidatus Anaeroferrophillus wilburensis]MBN2889094.1 ATP synthase F0 subunit B [Deltaproteobacteria bacterium]
MIDLNSTLVIQWVIFIFVMIFLNQFLFKPVLRIVDARREKVEGTQESAAQTNARTREHKESYETQIAQAQERLARESQAVREKTAGAAREQMDKARDEAMRLVESMRQRIDVEYDKVRAEMAGDIDQVARLISGKILGRDV